MERSYCLDFLMLVYLKISVPGVGVDQSLESCKKLFFTFSTIPMEDFLNEFDELNQLLNSETLNVYSWVLFSPFRSQPYGDGQPKMVWFEKFCFIYLFSLLKFLNLT